MSGNSRVWVDMTDLQVWSGHMTGVQRVVYQNAKRYAESPKYDAHFFVFDDRRKVFTEVLFEDIQQEVERAFTAAGASTPQGVGRAERIKRIPRAIVRRIPASVKQHVPAVVKQGLKRGAKFGFGTAKKTYGVLKSGMRPAPRNAAPAITFNSQDTLVILGKSWDMPELIPTLGKLKQAQGFKLVHLIHDMIPTLEPHLFGPGLFEPYTKCMFEVCALSDGILANSQSTKRDILRFCKMVAISPPQVEVVRLGDDLMNLELDPNMPAPNPRIKKGEFILQVGTIELRKNHLEVYLAYREAALRGITLPTWVIMGSQGWMVGDLLHQIEHDPVVKDNIIVLRGRPDVERLWLYRNCRFTVFPSTYEGWGMPVGESLAYGKVCITSTTASLPEVGGRFADTVSPYNSQEMLETMVQYLDNKKLRMREEEIKGYTPASWDDTFCQVDTFVRSLSK